MAEADVIDTLVGIRPGSALDAIRARRPEARAQAQASWRALFAPAAPGGVTLEDRFAVAYFVTGLHGQADIAAFHAQKLAAARRAAVDAAVAEARGQGPYGSYPAGPLSQENAPGPVYRAGAATRQALGAKLAAAFEHVHMLVFHPRDAEPGSLQAMLDAGWSTDDIVTLSQLVAFLSFQIRAVAGLRVLAAADPRAPQ